MSPDNDLPAGEGSDLSVSDTEMIRLLSLNVAECRCESLQDKGGDGRRVNDCSRHLMVLSVTEEFYCTGWNEP